MRSQYQLWANEVRVPMPVKGGMAWVVYDLLTGDRVQHDDGSTSPKEFTYVEFPDDPALPYFVVELEQTGTPLAPRIIAVQAIARDERRQVLAADLRRFRLEDAVENAWKLVARHPTPVTNASDAPISSKAAMGRFEDDAARRRTVRRLRNYARNTVTDDTLKKVAAIYRKNPDAPTKAVGREMGFAPSTASLYVRRAREAGFLPPR